ncbi:MAG: hypothetical protein WCT03_15290 [Candidatus Obscuribacterales bacterium]
MKSISIPKFATRMLLGLSVALTAHLSTIQDVAARNYFVSPAGSGTTGQNWAKAWKDPSQIDWTKIVSGDHIVIDGGTSGITYKTSLTVPASNIVIRQSNAAGHSGQVVFNGAMPGYPLATGIKFVGSNIHLVAVRRSGIKIESFGAEGVNIQTNNNSLRNVEISKVSGFPPYLGGRIAGATFGGVNNHFINCDFRDCGVSALDRPVAGVANSTVFNNCTFGANGYGFFMNCGTGILGSKTVGGPASTIFAHKCVFGPYVDYGVDIANGNVRLTDSLFLFARLANIKVAPAAGSTASATVANCTVYQNKLVLDPFRPLPYGLPQHAVSVNASGKLKVTNSIIFGGFVDIPASQKVNAGGNVQYSVSGNTVALAPTLADPLFVTSNIYFPAAPTAFIPQAYTLFDFSVKPGSPAVGKGTSIGAVTNICMPYGPTRGLPTAIGGP